MFRSLRAIIMLNVLAFGPSALVWGVLAAGVVLSLLGTCCGRKGTGVTASVIGGLMGLAAAAVVVPLAALWLPVLAVLSMLPLPIIGDVASVAVLYLRCLFFYARRAGQKYEPCPLLAGGTSESTHARVHVYSLASMLFFLWDQKHYRHDTFNTDMLLNLRNVAVPGTGLPLSLLCRSWIVTALFVAFGYPVLALLGAIRAEGPCSRRIVTRFREFLLTPTDWFALWRLNCRLAALHYTATEDPGYAYEDKWKFLKDAKAAGVPVSPWIDIRKMVVKHRNEEGGLGFHCFNNAVTGGDWILQPSLSNAGSIQEMLPEDAPLSTFRVLTASTQGLPGDASVRTLTSVWRAGRSGARTDHVSVLFDVDSKTGSVRRGTTNQHWYQLGPLKWLSTPWTRDVEFLEHPDTHKRVEGKVVREMREIVRVAEKAHRDMVPGVPLVGWDVAVTDKGILLLEGNFSCNFFMGTVDYEWYFQFCEAQFRRLTAGRK